jgi:hypothetical protein
MLVLLLKILYIFIFFDPLQESRGSELIHLNEFLGPELFELGFGELIEGVPCVLSASEGLGRVLEDIVLQREPRDVKIFSLRYCALKPLTGHLLELGMK